jgi:pimeloyl-ACP methyl ester carboxylesterase
MTTLWSFFAAVGHFLIAGSHAMTVQDTILSEDFCPMYYWGSADCNALKKLVRFNHTRPAPTLELGDPSKPPMFFFHGWPDTAALWVNQFEYFCAPPNGKYFCVAPTWMNFHPDLPDAPTKDLFLDVQVARMYATAQEMGLTGITLVIFDFGAALGYQFAYKHPEAVKTVVAFDIGLDLVSPPGSKHRMFGDAQIPFLPQYQQANIESFRTNSFAPMQPFKDMLMKALWRGHDPKFFTARTGWPYNDIVRNATGEEMSERLAPNVPFKDWQFHEIPSFPDDKPLLFLYGKCDDGSGCDNCPLGRECRPRPMQFHSASFEKWVNSRVGSEVVAVDGAGHWMMTQQSASVNAKLAAWLDELGSKELIV